MRESFDLQERISLLGAPVAPELDCARGDRQGEVWMGLTHGTRCWTMPCRSLQHVEKLKELGFRLATDCRIAQKKIRGSSGSVMDCGGRVLHHLCSADDPYAMAGTVAHLTCILKDMRYYTERLGMLCKEKRLAIVAGPYTDYKAGDTVEITGDDGCGAWWMVWMRWARGWVYVAAQRLASWHRIGKSQFSVPRKEILAVRSQGSGQEAQTCLLLHVCGCCTARAGEWAHTQSMFQALRIWELGQTQTCFMFSQEDRRDWVWTA